MDNQIILACDDNGNFLGEYIPKEVGHSGSGKRHLAITVLVTNSKGEVLLQKRKHKVFDNIWDLTGATHPLHKENGSDESFEESTLRCLQREYGIKESEVRNLKNHGSFNYFAQYGDLCEHEHCAMLTATFNGEISLNPEVGYNYKWMPKEEFLKDIEKHPQNYSPWAFEGVSLLHSTQIP